MEKTVQGQEQRTGTTQQREQEKPRNSAYAQRDVAASHKGIQFIRQGGALEDMPPNQIQSLSAHIGNDALQALLGAGEPIETMCFSLPEPSGEVAVNAIKTQPPRLHDPAGLTELAGTVPGVTPLAIRGRDSPQGEWARAGGAQEVSAAYE